jgi:TolA-binding protein
MERIKVNINELTELDLNLARNDRAIAFAGEIVKLSLDDRTQRLNSLQQKIHDKTASLFEEKVLAKLLENRTAERIRVIRKNLPRIEEELKKRKKSQSSPVVTRAVRSDDNSSKLLEFLATQKPPSPSSAKPFDKQRSNAMVPSSAEKPSVRNVKDIFVGICLVVALALAFWYTVSSEESPPTITTFDQQATVDSSESGLSKETLQMIQNQFDDALQELRFGDFEQGKTLLLSLIQSYPNTAQAQDASIAIADTYRQRQNHPDEALKYYQTFTTQYPDSPRVGLVLLKMGFTYEDMEDIDSAEAMYHLVLSRHGEKSRLGQLANERLQALKAQ